MKLYIINTAYHLILSIADMEASHNKGDIIIFKDFNMDKELYNKVKQKFNNVYIFNGTTEKKVMLRLFENLKFIYFGKYKVSNNYEEVIYFNDYRLEIQVLINYFKKSNTKFSYMEDGFAAYGSYTIKKKYFNYIIKKIITGFRYKHVFVIGTFIQPNTVKVINKEFIRKELINNRVEEINIDSITKSIKYIYKEKINSIEIKDYSVVLLVDHSQVIRDREKYIRAIENIFDLYKDRNFYIKYHPRENCEFIKNNQYNFNYIDKSINSEAILFKCKMNNIIFVSGMGTSLIIASKLLDEKDRIISIARGNFCDENIKYIEEMGINVL